MTGANKILTVSYGTFSCTLEGFDDPFNTMKAIAEYFRDLAADDRYFGAEPPTPDAAMLHRIAEREVQRRVEAKIDQNGITLRTGEAMAPVAPVVPQSTPMPVHVEAAAPLAPSVDQTADDGVAARLQRLRRAAAADGVTPSATATSAVVAWASDEADNLYEDEHFEAAPAADLLLEAANDFAEDAVYLDISTDFDAQDVESEPVETAAELLVVEETTLQVVMNDAQDTEVEAVVLAAAQEVVTQEPEETVESSDPSPVEADLSFDAFDIAPAIAETLADDANSVHDEVAKTEAVAPDDDQAAMLDRLILGREDSPRIDEQPGLEAPVETANGVVLSDLIATMTEGPDLTENLGHTANTEAEADFANPYDMTDLDRIDLDDIDLDTASAADFADDLPEARDIEDPEEIAELAAMDGVDADAIADFAAAETVTDSEDASFAAAETVTESEDAGFAAAADDRLYNDIAPAETAVEPAAQPAAEDSDVPGAEAHDVAAYSDIDDDTDAAALDDDETAPGLLNKAQMARARVIKIRRPGTTERPTMLGSEPPAASQNPTLSDKAEAELIAELADAEAAGAAANPPGADADKDADMARLLRQADTEMAGPENRRRLSAIAHLKAAVAATIADRRIGRAKNPAEEERLDPYRDDLARAVRPSRPDEAEAPAQTDRPAPLVLVSEQRIDRPKVASTAAIVAVTETRPPAAPVVPVRPRRIVAGASSAAVAEPLVDAIAQTDLADDVPDDLLDLEDGENFDDAAIFADPRSFSEFAERVGAEDLPSLLQAAAAYAMEIEEMPSFTRPQLMRQIEAHGDAGEFQREDVLRSFGNLLRTGDFIKKRRGQYALQQDAPILAQARKMVGEN